MTEVFYYCHMLKSANTSTGTGQMSTDNKNKTENVERKKQSWYWFRPLWHPELDFKKSFIFWTLVFPVPQRCILNRWDLSSFEIWVSLSAVIE